MERSDTERLDWLLEVLELGAEGEDSTVRADRKTLIMAAAVVMGYSGRAAIDSAMDTFERQQQMHTVGPRLD